MKRYCLVGGLVWVVLLCAVLPVAAQSDAVFLGKLSEPFATFVATGDLNYPGQLDWYAFEVLDDGTAIHVLADAADGEPGIRTLLFGPDGSYITAAEDDLLTATLDAGTYRIRIDSVESALRRYSLVVFAGAETESNDGLLEATGLGEVVRPLTLIGSLLPEGDADVFAFSIPENGLPLGDNVLTVETGGPWDGDTTLVLYRYSAPDHRYLPIAADDDSGEGYWSRLLLYPRGSNRYAVRVEETTYPLEGVDSYLLSLAPHRLGADAEPNNTPTEAIPLDRTTADGWAAEGLLDPADLVDFYALSLQTASLVHIWTEPQPETGNFDTTLGLYSATGEQLAENDDAEDTSWSRLVAVLEPGTYAVAVKASDPDSALLPYRLRVSARRVRSALETEPNDAPDTAEPIEWPSEHALVIDASVDPEADIDAFRFVLGEETRVFLQVGPRTGSTEIYDTTLSVYDETLEEVAYNDDADGAWSRIEETLPPGLYYAVVESYYGDETFEYELLMMAP